MKFWPFPLIRNYSTSDGLSELFERFASAADLKVENTGIYQLTLTCSHGTLAFWDANKWYAWASEGRYTPPEGVPVAWKDEMPSRWAARKMRAAIDRRFATSFDEELQKADSARRTAVSALARVKC